MTTGTLTIHMGAARWGATVHRPDGDVHYDFRDMSPEERRKWHGQLMTGARRIYGENDWSRGKALPSGRRGRGASR